MSPSTARPALGAPAGRPTTDWAAEMELVALCARPTLTPGHTERLTVLVEGDPEWERVLDRARVHGVRGMVYHHLTQESIPRIPAEVRDTLGAASRRTQVENLQALQELRRLAGVFEEADVPLLTFKGPLLAQHCYGNVAFRQFGDVDVLVQRPHLDRAQALLETHGYEPVRDLSDAEVKRRHEEQLGLEFRHRETGLVVELHWALLNRTFSFRLTPSEVWERARTVSLGTASVHRLGPYDRVLYLCAHGTKHHWSRLLCACDVAQVLHTESALDWERLLAKAREIGSRRTLALGLRLTERWLGQSLPPAARAMVEAESRVDALVHEIENQWFGTQSGRRATADASTFWFFLRTRERWRDNGALIRHYLRLAAAPTENDRALTPEGLGGLQYLVRPVRLLVEGGRWMWRHLPALSLSPSSYVRRGGQLVQKVRRRSWAERWDLVVAFGAAVLIAVLLHTCSFQRVQRLVDRGAQTGRSPGQLGKNEEERLLWAVRAASRRLLPQRPCLTQALTARLLLGRRGARPTTLQIGVARDGPTSLAAHAWLERDGTVLAGGAASPDQYVRLEAQGEASASGEASAEVRES